MKYQGNVPIGYYMGKAKSPFYIRYPEIRVVCSRIVIRDIRKQSHNNKLIKIYKLYSSSTTLTNNTYNGQPGLER